MATTRPVILAFGLKPERLLDTEGRIDAFLEPPKREQGEVLVEAVRSGVEAGGHVIAIVPAWFAEEGLMRLQMVQSLLDTDRVAVHRTPLPPLAGAVLASLASAAAAHTQGPGVLASLLPELEAELHVFTWLGSVSGLHTPSPSLAQHMASLTPGTAFGVSSWPEPSVHKLKSGTATVPVPQLARPSRLAVAPRAGDAGWLTGPVNAALGGLEVRQVEATPNGPSWWGTGKLVEGVAFPTDVDRLVAELTAELEPWVCRWCREPVARVPCPLCGHRGRPARRRPAA
ncbi:MAG TPA: hypothetical protein VF533_09200 [Solirubrobacteraceae bacterium]|jgi:hypothetical protein